MSDPRILSEGDYTDHFETKYRGALIDVAALRQLVREMADALEYEATGAKPRDAERMMALVRRAREITGGAE